MKLNIKFPELEALINKMGAKKTLWKSGIKYEKIVIQKLLSVEGVDAKLEDIQMDEYGLMYLNNEPVVLFIKDQWISADEIRKDPFGGKGYRFHVTGTCKTIEQMQKRKKYDRYTFTANQSGKFSVIARESRYSNKKIKLTTPLAVCMNCLIDLEYEGAGYSSRGRPNVEAREARNSFNIKSFFKDYVQTLISRPKYSEISYPDPEYSSDFRTVSKKLKEAWKHKCSRCEVDLSLLGHRHMLHCHHKDSNPGNNNETNLEILCICCHASEGWHLLNLPANKKAYEKCLEIKEEQGIKND